MEEEFNWLTYNYENEPYERLSWSKFQDLVEKKEHYRKMKKQIEALTELVDKYIEVLNEIFRPNIDIKVNFEKYRIVGSNGKEYYLDQNPSLFYSIKEFHSCCPEHPFIGEHENLNINNNFEEEEKKAKERERIGIGQKGI